MRVVQYHAPDYDKDRKALKVPQHWPTGVRLCVVFDESSRGNSSVMELGSLMSCRVPTADVDQYSEPSALLPKRAKQMLRRTMEDFDSFDLRYSRTKAKQALAEGVPQKVTNAGVRT